MKTIKALISFVYIGANGSITSYAGGQVYEVANEIATQLISIGYAEEVSGGGGSSDFSTAEVTITNNGSASRSLGLPVCTESELTPLGHAVLINRTEEVGTGESATFKVPLYKGYTMFNTSLTVQTSGNITYNSTYRLYLITGDCTITIS